MVLLPRNKKQTHRLNFRLQMWPLGLTLAMTLTLNFQGQILNWLYLSQKWSDCHKNKKQTHRLNSRLQMWPLGLTFAMTLTLNFQGQISNWLYLSHKLCDCHETKRKAYISIDLKTSNVTIGFDLGHDLDLGFSRSNMKFATSQPKVDRLPRNEKQTYQFEL